MSEGNMEDIELDELLNRWHVPAAPAELREKARTAFRASRERAPRQRGRFLFALKPVFSGAVIGGVLCGLLLTQALPQTVRATSPLFRIPYTVEWEFVNFDERGAGAVHMYGTSYMDRGNEVMLSSAIPGRPVVTAVRRILETTGFLWRQIAGAEGWAGAADFVRLGCVSEGQTPLERTSIVGYSTVAVQTGSAPQMRVTLWRAPDLDCFALKMRMEEWQKDGFYRVVSEKHALAVIRQ
jgi:hypothetical protein